MKIARFVTAYCIVVLSMTICHCAKTDDLSGEDPAFVQAEREWREARDESMRRPSSWLTIAGLFWLTEGRHSFGAAQENAIQLPGRDTPAVAGEIIVSDDEVILIPGADASLKIDGEKAGEKILKSDASGSADVIELNDLKMWVIERGGNYALRLRDANEPRYLNYRGLNFYPPREKYVINAEFIPYENPRKVTVATVVGTESEMTAPGTVSFTIAGKQLSLQAFSSGGGRNGLFFIFKDKTSGKKTYQAARFLQAEILADGRSIELNFNRAYNPPCAYTPYATCPLPPPENILPVKIEAGEQIYSKKH